MLEVIFFPEVRFTVPELVFVLLLSDEAEVIINNKMLLM